MIDKQVVSKERVVRHGEVYTNEREVNAMLDLVEYETKRIDSRFLEPACGTGNFLTAILTRKLRVVKTRYRKSQIEYERYAVLAVSSIYGIDILADNVQECRNRLFSIFDSDYTDSFAAKTKDGCRAAVQYILERNIIHGDALTLQTVKTDAADPRPIVFSEWSFPRHNNLIARRDFIFSELFPPSPNDPPGLLAAPPLISDTGKPVFIPQEIKIYRPVNFLNIKEGYEKQL